MLRGKLCVLCASVVKKRWMAELVSEAQEISPSPHPLRLCGGTWVILWGLPARGDFPSPPSCGRLGGRPDRRPGHPGVGAVGCREEVTEGWRRPS
jgi:hypothetical protein